MSDMILSEQLQWICRSALLGAFPSLGKADVFASFYPYVGLTHTIRRKGMTWTIRISDHCRQAPRVVLEAITVILGCKVLRRRPPREMIRVYDRFREEPAIRALLRERRQRRGRKRIGSPEGKNHSLTVVYEEVNRRFFNGQVEISRIGWGERRSWQRLGHYDPDHNTVTISPVLDSPRVPGYVVSFIVYHEILHSLFGDPSGADRPHHPREFRKAEKSHPDYAAARRFLRDYCARRRL
jgi:hypothetical protein